MRFLALALLVLGVANAHHTPEHQLSYPRFVSQKTHLYDVMINVTSGIPGLHPQVSKSVMSMELKIYAQSPKELLLSCNKVMVSNSLSSQSSDTESVSLKPDRSLEEKLRIPFKATFEDGMVTRYTLDQSETVESAKIKRTILRNLEIYLDTEHLKEDKQWYPFTYNKTRSSRWGDYRSHYMITSSPYVAFPQETNVWNITRHDNYENVPYFAYQSHHNFEKQGCPEVCKRNYTENENKYGAGCPVGYEPHNTPLKKSFYQQHNLRMLKSGEHIIDMVRTKETHVADLYDQNMEVSMKTLLKFRQTTTETIQEKSGQPSYTDLNDLTKEINEDEISQHCAYPDEREAVEACKQHLKEIAEIIIEGEVNSPKSKQIGEQVILLQKALQMLKKSGLRSVEESIVSYGQLSRASQHDKVKRQIWLDALPVIGTSESVSYIVELIHENINKPVQALSLWEAKVILEALPLNIHNPTERTITELSRLLDVNSPEAQGYKFYYSASYLAIARVVRRMCATDNGTQEERPYESSPRRQRMEFLLREMPSQYRRCPKAIVKKFVQDVVEKLKRTDDRTKRIIYIQTLARTGLEEVIPVLKKYVHGHFSGESQSYINYVRSVAIHTLYHFTSAHQQKVIDIVWPIFMNKTETPRIRTGAFGVLLNCQPSLGLLQDIAAHTWKETSLEVASYVTSTLDTYGNSTIPCHQLTAQRILKIRSQIKQSYHGQQKSRNMFWGYYDQSRRLGYEQRYEFTASNESFIPAVIYESFGYSTDSLKDMLYQLAINTQGFTTKDWYDTLANIIGIGAPSEIPKESESSIFKQAEIVDRDPEFWRFTLYERMFYTSSYNYFDAEETNFQDYINMAQEYLTHYFGWNERQSMDGHIVKIYMPSSYHSKSIGHAMPSAIEFEMKSPVVLSLRLKIKPESASSGWSKYSLDINPSVYYTTLYTQQYLNLGDCKDIGVYYKNRVALTYPFKMTVGMHRSGEVSLSYSVPELPKTVLAYNSDSGSYAGKKQLTSLPFMEEQRVYKTIPSQFAKRNTFGLVALPPLVSEVLTEDMQLGLEEIPRTVEDFSYWILAKFYNVGWRRQSVHIKRVPDSGVWNSNSEVKVYFNYTQQFVTPHSRSDEDWSRDLKFDDSLNRRDSSAYAAEGHQIYQKMRHQLSHGSHKLYIDFEQSKGSRYEPLAQLFVTYNHTLGGYLHLIHLQATANGGKYNRPIEVTCDYAVALTSKPNEFKYGSQSYGKQKGIAVGAISFTNTSVPFEHPDVVSKAVFGYKPLESVLREEMVPPPSREDLYPETHEQCLEDVSSGKPWTQACKKAIQEAANYNNINMHVLWDKELPSYVKEWADKFDMALKHVFFHRISFEKKQSSNKEFRLEATYIDQMTDSPVVDVVLQKPSEILSCKRLSTSFIRPLNSINNLWETYFSELTNNTYPATCVLMDKYVKTFDWMTYRLPKEMPACTYVLSTHCIENKKFAVLVKIDPHSPVTEEVIIHVGSDKLVLVPSGKSEYRIRYNGQEQPVRESRPWVFDEDSKLYAFVNKNNDGSYHLEVHAGQAGFKVIYDGVNVKLQVHPRYRGEMCGLCSEFNGEIVRELRGVDRCLYSSNADFIKTAMVDSCGDKTPSSPYICNDDEIYSARSNWQNRDDEEGHEPTMKRNIVLSRESELCFSTKPVPVCPENASPRMSEPRQLGFHCLPKQDRNARKLVVESKRRILGELETKSIDLTEIVQVAKQC